MHRWCWLFLLSHYRSVKREDETLKAKNDAESQAPRDGVELNLKGKMRFRANFRGNAPGAAHEHGKTLFAQLMDFPPWTTFTHIVHRQSVTAMQSLVCTEQFRVMVEELATENSMLMGNIRETGKAQGLLKSSRS